MVERQLVYVHYYSDLQHRVIVTVTLLQTNVVAIVNYVLLLSYYIVYSSH